MNVVAVLLEMTEMSRMVAIETKGYRVYKFASGLMKIWEKISYGSRRGENYTCSNLLLPLKLRHNRAKSIAGSPCGDRGLESCKNPAAIRRFGTHPGLIRR